MFNPSDFPQGPGSYKSLMKRMVQNIQDTKLDEQLLELMKSAFQTELGKQNVILSRPERKRLFQQVAKAVFEGALEKIDGSGKK